MATAAPTAHLEAALTTWRRTGAPEDAAALEAHARTALAGWTPPVTSSPRTLLAVEKLIDASSSFRVVLTPKNDPISHKDHFHIEANPSYATAAPRS